MSDTPFKPARGANRKVTATTTSAVVTVGAGSSSLRLVNAGTVVGYVVTYKASDETRTASASDTPVAVSGAAGSVLVINKPLDHDSVAYISDSATTILHIQPGEGGY